MRTMKAFIEPGVVTCLHLHNYTLSGVCMSRFLQMCSVSHCNGSVTQIKILVCSKTYQPRMYHVLDNRYD